MKRQQTKRKNTKKTTASPSFRSFIQVSEHRHTGKHLPHRHTSHGALLGLLVFVGVILFSSMSVFAAYGITSSVSISATVPGNSPTTGAVITTPITKSRVKHQMTQISGTCPSGNTAAIYRNGNFAGSGSCNTSDKFSVTVQLAKNVNVIQAQNYDSLNQAGPMTAQIEVEYTPEAATPITDTSGLIIQDTVVNQPSDIVVDKSIPDTTAPQPPADGCTDSSAPSGQIVLGLGVGCVTRNVFVGETLQLPVDIWGGIKPYALMVDWGDSTGSKLYSFQASGHHVLAYTYKLPLIHTISLSLADSTGANYQVQTVAEINTSNGSTPIQVPGAPTFIGQITDSIKNNWVQLSVPIYWAAVTLVLGFWVGDLLQRFNLMRKTHRRHA